MKKVFSLFQIYLLVCIMLCSMLCLLTVSAFAEEGSVLIKKGDYDENVILLHQKLTDIGIFKLRAESPYGPQSESAVKALQGVLGKEKTGVISTAAELDEILSLDNSDNIDVKLGWVQDSNGWKYYEGTPVSNCWQLVNDVWYRFGTDEYMLSNTWFKEGDNVYWLESSGAMAKSKWVLIEDIWYYFKGSGKMATNEYIGEYWVDENGHWIENYGK